MVGVIALLNPGMCGSRLFFKGGDFFLFLQGQADIVEAVQQAMFKVLVNVEFDHATIRA